MDPEFNTLEAASGFIAAWIMAVPIIWGALHMAVIKPLRALLSDALEKQESALRERDAAVADKNEFLIRLLRKAGVVGD